MTKRERLKQQLVENERRLEYLKTALTCKCICHENIEIMHFMGCCPGMSGNIKEQIASEEEVVLALKKKLRL